jgi:sugar lactone lactonase YvrE
MVTNRFTAQYLPNILGVAAALILVGVCTVFRHCSPMTPPNKLVPANDERFLILKSDFESPPNVNGAAGNPIGLATDGKGDLVVADSNTDTVTIFAPNGAFRADFRSNESFIREFYFPATTARDSKGLIYGVDAVNGAVQCYSNGGIRMTTFPLPRMTGADVPCPSGVAVNSSNDIYATDTGTDRVVRWSHNDKGQVIYDYRGTSDSANAASDTPGSVQLTGGSHASITTRGYQGDVDAQRRQISTPSEMPPMALQELTVDKQGAVSVERGGSGKNSFTIPVTPAS